MRIYIDLNCFNRPFDVQTQSRIANETEAVFEILQRVIEGRDDLVWSAVLDFENSQHPLTDRSKEIGKWENVATECIEIGEEVRLLSEKIRSKGVKDLDAAHLACAELAPSDYFLTCDDRLLRVAGRLDLNVKACNPVAYLEELANA